jgi:hypothetical protein
MRFMMFIKFDPAVYDAEVNPDDFDVMGRYNEELTKAGALLALDGLQPPSLGARVDFDGDGKPHVSDGPYAEAKEVIGGYWIIQTKTREEAIEWASRVPCDPGQAVELRQIFEMSDFSPEVQAKFDAERVTPTAQPDGTL